MKAIIILFCLLITSCSPVSSNWSCKNDLSGSCKNIRDIDSGATSISNNSKNAQNNYFNNKNNYYRYNNTAFNEFRSEESVARVVFAPFIDEAGNRHDTSIVYYLEQKSDWKK